MKLESKFNLEDSNQLLFDHLQCTMLKVPTSGHTDSTPSEVNTHPGSSAYQMNMYPPPPVSSLTFRLFSVSSILWPIPWRKSYFSPFPKVFIRVHVNLQHQVFCRGPSPKELTSIISRKSLSLSKLN